MSIHVPLKSLVLKHMADLISIGGLLVTEVADCEVLLRSDTYAIDVYADKDGVSMVYFDKAEKPMKGYNIYLFLMNRRRNLLTFATQKSQFASHEEFVEAEVAALAQHIRSAGKDLLTGSKEWIKSYSWPTLSPSVSIEPFVSQYTNQRGQHRN